VCKKVRVRRELGKRFSGKRQTGMGSCGSHDRSLLVGAGQGKLSDEVVTLTYFFLVELVRFLPIMEPHQLEDMSHEASILLQHFPRRGWNGYSDSVTSLWPHFPSSPST